MPRKKVEEPVRLNVKPLIKQIAKEKDLDPEVIKLAIESAILSAAQKRANAFIEPRPFLDLDTGDMTLFVQKEVVISVEDPRQQIDILSAKARNPHHMLGDKIEVEIEPEEFGRIAAQSVRQGILQRLRDAERDRVYIEYKDRVGQVVTGIVQRYERRDAVVQLNKTDCLLPHQEIPRGVRYRFGDRIRCLIVDVRRTPKGPQVILSRTRSELVKQLFSLEVPEIDQGVVRIVEIAREPGVRTKIAVNSLNPDVDPVGACVGMKGSRVQMIVRELDNEKVDIVPWSQDPENFIASALNPAQIMSIKLNEIQRRAEVMVDTDSLSKAIGKGGQNAKLAAKLTGWKIDIVEQEDAAVTAQQEEISRQYLSDFLSQIEGIGEFAREALLRTSELNTVEKITEAEPEQLLPFVNDDQDLAEDIIEGAKEYLEELRKMTEDSESLMDNALRERLSKIQALADRLIDAPPKTDTPDEDVIAAKEMTAEGGPVPEGLAAEDVADLSPTGAEDAPATEPMTSEVDPPASEMAGSPEAEQTEESPEAAVEEVPVEEGAVEEAPVEEVPASDPMTSEVQPPASEMQASPAPDEEPVALPEDESAARFVEPEAAPDTEAPKE
ncbi:MAG: transcription termination factor NusA [Sumerlaeia bacterium]